MERVTRLELAIRVTVENSTNFPSCKNNVGKRWTASDVLTNVLTYAKPVETSEVAFLDCLLF